MLLESLHLNLETDLLRACPRLSGFSLAGDLSRNRTVGLRIGKGEKLSEIVDGMTAVAEGVLTSRSAHNLAVKLNVDVGSLPPTPN